MFILMLLTAVAALGLAIFCYAAYRRGAAWVFIALAFALLFALPARAQVIDGIITEATPFLMEIVSIIVLALIGWASAWAKRKFGIDIEAKHRTALHSALMSGALLAVHRQMTGDAAVRIILDFARKSVPDAIDYFKPSAAVLSDLAESKLQDALSQALGKAGVKVPSPR